MRNNQIHSSNICYKANGFTLVELLIVVIILAILAAIVVPQFASSTDDAKLAAADSTLTNMRAAIDLYYQQHGKYPAAQTASPTASCTGLGASPGAGAANTTAAFFEQLSLYTDTNGGACSVSDATNHKLGPYLKKDALPPEPVSGISTLTVVADSNLKMAADGTTGGWKYSTKTGKFIINHTDRDDR